jgi:hypothetical protein
VGGFADHSAGIGTGARKNENVFIEAAKKRVSRTTVGAVRRNESRRDHASGLAGRITAIVRGANDSGMTPVRRRGSEPDAYAARVADGVS